MHRGTPHPVLALEPAPAAAGTTAPVPAAAAPSADITIRSGLLNRLGVAARLARTATPTRTVPELRTERLLLRPLVRADRDEFLRVLRLSEKHLAPFCPLGTGTRDDPHARESHDSIFERQLALSDGALATGRAWRMAAFDADRLVGAFNINDIHRGLEHIGEAVFWLSADATGRGYAEEGLRATLAHALKELPEGLGLHRITALIAPDNDPCRALAAKVGLVLSPTAPRLELALEGRRVAHDVYEIFAEIPAPIPAHRARRTNQPVVEAKPSVAESIFGRGLLTILHTEGLDPPTPPTLPTPTRPG